MYLKVENLIKTRVSLNFLFAKAKKNLIRKKEAIFKHTKRAYFFTQFQRILFKSETNWPYKFFVHKLRLSKFLTRSRLISAKHVVKHYFDNRNAACQLFAISRLRAMQRPFLPRHERRKTRGDECRAQQITKLTYPTCATLHKDTQPPRCSLFSFS